MNVRPRTDDLKCRVSQLIDKKLLPFVDSRIDKKLVKIFPQKDSKLALDTLIGIKISLIKYQDCRISHQNAVESIFSKLSTITFQISEPDRLRLKNIIVPRLDDALLSWDSASKEVSFWDAVELFEADLAYLLSDDLSRYLPATCIAARDQVVARIRTTRLHPKFGRGSKVSYDQYYELIDATAGGWMAHLAEQGSSVNAEPVYELGPPQIIQDDHEPLCEGWTVERMNNYEQGTTNT